MFKPETRIIPDLVPPKFFAEHLKAYEFLIENAPRGKVLEVGCGDGYGAAYLAKAGFEVAAVDYDEAAIAAAKAKYSRPGLEFLSMAAGDLRFEDGSFDLVCSFQVIEHIPEPDIPLYLSEIKRVLKPQGVFYLSTLNLEHARKSPVSYMKNPAHCKEFVLEELRSLLLSRFPQVEIYGLYLTVWHRFCLRLKKIGLPVKWFYDSITTADFRVVPGNLRKAVSFICVCGKSSGTGNKA